MSRPACRKIRRWYAHIWPDKTIGGLDPIWGDFNPVLYQTKKRARKEAAEFDPRPRVVKVELVVEGESDE